MSKKNTTVAINVPYLVELVEKSGMTRADFSRNVLLRQKNYVTSLIMDGGRVSPFMVDILVKHAGADRKRLLDPVPYNKEDYRLNAAPYSAIRKEKTEKDGTIAEYIALISNSLIELAKNQKQVGELLTVTSKLDVDNRKCNEETGKLLQIILETINHIGKQVDEIHKELR